MKDGRLLPAAMLAVGAILVVFGLIIVVKGDSSSPERTFSDVVSEVGLFAPSDISPEGTEVIATLTPEDVVGRELGLRSLLSCDDPAVEAGTPCGDLHSSSEPDRGRYIFLIRTAPTEPLGWALVLSTNGGFEVSATAPFKPGEDRPRFGDD